MDTVVAAVVDAVGWKMQVGVPELVHIVDVDKASNYRWLH